jgi:two-component system CheB/CheR fusion protein
MASASDQGAPGQPDAPLPPMPDHAIPVVGMGASAGGIVAIRTFLELMPARTGMAFVIILHLSPKHESSVDVVLQQVTRMPVIQVKDTTLLEADHVYVISPQNELEIVDGYLRVKPTKRVRGQHIAVDVFLRTLADARRDRAFAIILSGTGADGSQGVARIREMGGVTLAQSPDDSEYSDMPRNAIATGTVDFVLPISDMPQKLVELWENARRISLPLEHGNEPVAHTKPDTSAEAEKALRDILDMLAVRSGHDFRHYKRATVLRRIERRLQVNVLKDLPSYRDYLRDVPAETALLLNDMLISVTNFFRDREAFETLERDFIPAIFSTHSPDDPVRVWTPGCATGEEAYSLAILFAEQAIETGETDHYQVFASDIDEGAIAHARAGIYPESIIADVPPSRLRRFFTRDRERLRINKTIRDRVLFAAHNVLRDPPFSRVDLISCRNLLIYLDRSIQARVLELFYFALRPGGLLFLGSSESADAAESLFEAVDKKHRIFRARPLARGNRQVALLPLRPSEPRFAPVAFGSQASPGISYADVHRRVLEHYGPPSIVVDQEYNIVHMSDKVGRFLQHSAGEPSRSLLAVVKKELRSELRTTLFQALHSAKSVEARRVGMTLESKPVYVNMIARPFRDPEAGTDFILVLFDEVEDTLGAEPLGEASLGRDAVIHKLEDELQRNKVRLQSTIEQSDASSEELKASNEELQAINEELRSATEELETSKEELQSVNEELITVNFELKSKVDETAKVNDDLHNFISSTGIATVFVDAQLRIKRYTPAIESIFNIIPSDVGRRLLDITHSLDYPALFDDAAAAFERLQASEREVRGVDGKYYVVRALPYRTADNRIDGAVLNFFDVTSLRNAEEQASASESRLLLAATASQDFAIIVIDQAGHISAWNAGASAMFGYSAAEALGQSLNIVFLPEDITNNALDKELRTASQTGTASEDRWHLTRSGERIFCTGVLTAVESDQFRGFVKIVRDATLKHAAERRTGQRLRTAIAQRVEVETASAMQDDFLAVMSHELKNPLNLISVSTEIIGRVAEVRESTLALQSIAAIRRAVRGQTKIIDDLLDMSRIRTGKFTLNPAPVDLCGAVENIVEIARLDASSVGLELVFHCESNPAIVSADATRLEQIVWNLLSNAIKFTPEGGRVCVEVSVVDNEALLTVEDDGQGIHPDFLPRIFDLFGQAPGRALHGHRGLGIGLSLVRQLVDRHGGRITASSDGLGRGARFDVWLPTFKLDAPMTLALPAAVTQRLEGLVILIVEDADDAAVSLARLFEFEGATVVVANDGRMALDRMRSLAMDIVLSDIGMAGMDGYELVAEIRKQPQWVDLPVIAITGFGRQSDIEHASAAGFTAHVSKPIAIDDLIALIIRLRP